MRVEKPPRTAAPSPERTNESSFVAASLLNESVAAPLDASSVAHGSESPSRQIESVASPVTCAAKLYSAPCGADLFVHVAASAAPSPGSSSPPAAFVVTDGDAGYINAMCVRFRNEGTFYRTPL